jgi:integrase
MPAATRGEQGIDIRTLQAYLGHRSINSSTRYAALAPGFKNIWGKAWKTVRRPRGPDSTPQPLVSI